MQNPQKNRANHKNLIVAFLGAAVDACHASTGSMRKTRQIVLWTDSEAESIYCWFNVSMFNASIGEMSLGRSYA